VIEILAREMVLHPELTVDHVFGHAHAEIDAEAERRRLLATCASAFR
jgi:hypothetical protein